MKISKSDQDPHQTDQDKTEIEKILSKKSQHFAVGSRVIKAPNVGGTVTYHGPYCSQSEGLLVLVVRWDDGTKTEQLSPYSPRWS